jgi:uncharacterized integral membrane protein
MPSSLTTSITSTSQIAETSAMKCSKNKLSMIQFIYSVLICIIILILALVEVINQEDEHSPAESCHFL